MSPAPEGLQDLLAAVALAHLGGHHLQAGPQEGREAAAWAHVAAAAAASSGSAAPSGGSGSDSPNSTQQGHTCRNSSKSMVPEPSLSMSAIICRDPGGGRRGKAASQQGQAGVECFGCGGALVLLLLRQRTLPAAVARTFLISSFLGSKPSARMATLSSCVS